MRESEIEEMISGLYLQVSFMACAVHKVSHHKYMEWARHGGTESAEEKKKLEAIEEAIKPVRQILVALKKKSE